MYKNFFDLQSNPFGSSPDPRFLYVMPHVREALAGLEYGISARKGFIVLVGEVGTGKTTLLRSAIDSFDGNRVFVSFIFNPRLEPLDLLELILTDFGIKPEARTKSGMLLQLNRFVLECFRRDQTCVIVIDEAQNLSDDLLEEVRLLTNLETATEKLLQIIICGQPELEDKLRQPNLRQLRQRIALWCRTQPLTHEQTAAYITGRLSIAGSSTQIFSPEAVAAIHRISRGIPRIVNLLCEHSLILAYVEQLRVIPAGIVNAVSRDLDLEAQPVRSSSSPLLNGDANMKNEKNDLPHDDFTTNETQPGGLEQ